MARLALVRSEGTGQSDCRLGDYNAFIKHSYTSWWRRGVTGSSGLQQSLTSAAAARRRTSIACLSHNVCAPCSVPALPVQTPTSALRNHRLGSGGCGAWQRHPSCRCGVCSCSLRSRGGHGHGVGQTVGRGAVVALHGSSQLTGCCCERSGALQAARSTGSRETSWQPGAFAHNIAAAAGGGGARPAGPRGGGPAPARERRSRRPPPPPCTRHRLAATSQLASPQLLELCRQGRRCVPTPSACPPGAAAAQRCLQSWQIRRCW